MKSLFLKFADDIVVLLASLLGSLIRMRLETSDTKQLPDK